MTAPAGQRVHYYHNCTQPTILNAVTQFQKTVERERRDFGLAESLGAGLDGLFVFDPSAGLTPLHHTLRRARQVQLVQLNEELKSRPLQTRIVGRCNFSFVCIDQIFFGVDVALGSDSHFAMRLAVVAAVVVVGAVVDGQLVGNRKNGGACASS
jgi:hypothetical protein